MYFYRLKLCFQCLWLEFLVMFHASLVHLRFPPPSTHFTSRSRKRPCWSNTGGFIGHMWPVCFGEGAAGCISVPASSLCRRECPLICPVKGGTAGLRCTEAAAPRWRTVDSFFPVVACSAFSAQTGRIPQRLRSVRRMERRKQGEKEEVEVGGGDARPTIWEKGKELHTVHPFISTVVERN